MIGATESYDISKSEAMSVVLDAVMGRNNPGMGAGKTGLEAMV